MQTPVDTAAPRRTFLLFKLPPPMLFGLAFAAGALLDGLRHMPLPGAGRAMADLGTLILALGVASGLTLALTFLRLRTTLNPFAAPSRFVARGPYRLSRNPMYLTLITAYLGGTLMFGSAWPLLTLIAPVVILSRVVIPQEEAHMQATFGDSYRAYCASVRRWI